MNALSFGELLWDIIDGTPYIGGAPFNLAAHLARMGAGVSMITAVGDDELGRRALEQASRYGVDTQFIRTWPDSPTGTVEVYLDQAGLPDYTIHENVAWDRIELEANEIERIGSQSWDVFCFGTLAQRSEQNRRLLETIIGASRPASVFYDVNLRQSYYEEAWLEASLEHATIVKLNEEEAETISRMLFDEELSVRDFVTKIFKTFDLDVVLVTRGPEGAIVYNGSDFGTSETEDVEVVDTVGAGDSFSAAFLYSYLSGDDAFDASDTAAKVADFVVSRRGAVPDYSKELEELLGLR